MNRKKIKRIIAMILAFAMLNTTVDWRMLPAVYAQEEEAVCENHPVHDGECGYVEAVEGAECNHVHDETCYETVTSCVHEHTEECTQAVLHCEQADVPEHEHDENCYIDIDCCTHVCSEETGCITKTLLCKHVHDAACGYKEAVVGQPCEHSCEECGGGAIMSLAALQEPVYEKLEGYTFSVSVPLGLSSELSSLYGNLGNIVDFPTTIEGVKVYCGGTSGQYEIYETTMSVSGSLGTITGVPVYIQSGSGSEAEGGTGEYLVDTTNFYFLEVPVTVGNGMYRLEFQNEGSSLYCGGITLEQNENDLIWSAESKDTLVISQRAVRQYSYNVTFYGKEAMTDFPSSMEAAMSLTYDENGMIEVSPTIIANGNSSFQIVYKRIPTSPEIDATVRIKIAEYDGYRIYKDGTIFTPTEGGLAAGQVANQSFQYIQNTSMTGRVFWQDADGVNYRKTKEEIKDLIQVYKIAAVDEATDTLIDPTQYELELTEDTENEWNLAVTGLPLYEAGGRAIYYYYKVNAVQKKIPCADGIHYYKVSYGNTNNTSETELAYDGCNIYLTLAKDDSQYAVKVCWKDDIWNNANNEARKAEIEKEIKVYLWRGTSEDFSKAAPVYDENGNQYVCQLTEAEHMVDDEFPITQSAMGLSGEKYLPHYNENGKQYYYFVTAVDQGSNYRVAYEGGQNYVREGGTISLIRVGKGNIKTTVDWSKAIGESDYIGTKSVLQLQKRLQESGGDWADVENGEVTTAAASSSNPSLNTYLVP